MKIIYVVTVAIAMLWCNGVFAGRGRRSRNFNHNNNVQIVDVLQRRIDFDDRYFLGAEGYFSTANQIKYEEMQSDYNQLVLEHAQMKAQLELLTALIKELHNSGGGGGGENGPSTTPEDPEKPPVDAGDNEGYVPTALDAQIHAIVKENCARCHNEKSAAGNLKLFNNQTGALVALPLAWRLKVHEMVNGVGLEEKGLRRMPPNKTLEDDIVEAFRQWALEEASREVTK